MGDVATPKSQGYFLGGLSIGETAMRDGKAIVIVPSRS